MAKSKKNVYFVNSVTSIMKKTVEVAVKGRTYAFTPSSTDEQKIGSAKTSRPQICADAKKLPDMVGTGTRPIVLDYGCGAYHLTAHYLYSKGYRVMSYDLFNRCAINNEKARAIVKNIGADVILCNNVLNVVAEDNVVEGIAKDVAKLADTNTKIVFKIHEGDGTGIGCVTSDGYQRNEKTKEYIPIVNKYFTNVKKKTNEIHCTK